jgi:bifunctional UDP-N-acetylglucosamine pyrophosphorylase/glucosamine-1-phosphate N-acetyltransferase
MNLIIPAAGKGSRLGTEVPKTLVKVNGKPILYHILQRINVLFHRTIIVINPEQLHYFEEFKKSFNFAGPKLEFAFQEFPSGSLGAVQEGVTKSLTAGTPNFAVIVWGDQIGVSRETIERVIEELEKNGSGLVIPFMTQANPYVWLITDNQGKLTGVGRTRDGDFVPEVGNADLGVFGLGFELMKSLVTRDLLKSDPNRELDFTYALPILSNLSTHNSLFETVDKKQLLAINTPEELDRANEIF